MFDVFKLGPNDFVIVQNGRYKAGNLKDTIKHLRGLGVVDAEIEYGLVDLARFTTGRANYGINKTFIFATGKAVA
jgi:hypothetical protein